MEAIEPTVCILPGGMWHAAPDYARLTANKSDNSAALLAEYEYIALTVADWAGEDIRDTQQWGWNGYLGKRCGPVAWGAGYNGLILQAEGFAAERLRSLNPLYDNVARLDVQVTIWYDNDYESLARDIAPAVEAHRGKLRHRPFGLELRQGFGKGDTLYMGSRKSARYHRIYDKWRAPNGGEGYEHAWRFEVELKEGEGNGAWSAGGGALPTVDWWAAIVLREFAGRGIQLPRLVQGAMAPEARIPRAKTTTERRLHWLVRQVAPSIARIRAAGVSERIISAALTGDINAPIMWSRSLAENKGSGAADGPAPAPQQQSVTT